MTYASSTMDDCLDNAGWNKHGNLGMGGSYEAGTESQEVDSQPMATLGLVSLVTHTTDPQQHSFQMAVGGAHMLIM
jgi:hypothetical protein